MSGAVSPEIQRAVRGTDRQDCTGGDELPGWFFSCDYGSGLERTGPGVFLHEPAAGLRGNVSEPVAGGGDLLGREKPARGGKSRAEDFGGEFGV